MDYKLEFRKSEFIDIDTRESQLGSAVVPVLFRDRGQRVRKSGTAFFVAGEFHGRDWLLVTAKHVIDELEGARDIESFVMVPNRRGSNNLVGVPPTQACVAATHSDVALLVANLAMAPAPVSEPALLPVDFAPPAIGDVTIALGYGRPGPPVSSNVQYFLSGSRGTVEELHPSQRDKSFVNYPTFRTTALYPHGMSGGPILNERGRVIGVVTTGVDTESAPIGYGACTGALAEMKVELDPDGTGARDISVKELAEGGLMGQPCVSVTLERNEGGISLTWT